jgi:hypothetical protein
MGQVIDLKKKFLEYFNQTESFGLRSERFYEEYYNSKSKDPERMVEWLEAAFMIGAQVMAHDTLATLSDYGTAMAGLDDKKYTSTDAFDIASENLEPYYTEIFGSEFMNTEQSLDKVSMKQECNRMIASLVGPILVDDWWNSKNRAFDDQTPTEKWIKNPEQVYRYLQTYCYR